jgi:hypothetical protein
MFVHKCKDVHGYLDSIEWKGAGRIAGLEVPNASRLKACFEWCERE